VHVHKDLAELLDNFKNKPRILIMSLPHGKVIDDVLDQMEPHLNKGDIIIDGANEHFKATERRQARMKNKGVAYIGMGVSGGYQSSRRGPSMSPGGDKEAYAKVEPFLKDWAAKAADGSSCVEWVGPHGAGHYVKCIHNGIEQGQLSILAESWSLLHHTFGYSNEEISEVFKSWDAQGELADDFLVNLGAHILTFNVRIHI
jgi:6-phosphogluconate dehydrogenase